MYAGQFKVYTEILFFVNSTIPPFIPAPKGTGFSGGNIINYCFSRVLYQVMGNVSYSKIAMATGVLENIKQEFYRRVAETYEDKKIAENGDIKEYKKNHI
jgi:hypothetical protein